MLNNLRKELIVRVARTRGVGSESRLVVLGGFGGGRFWSLW